MKELLVISGKGGAGKTSMAGALASMAGEVVLADLDVDAPDMHLLLQPELESKESFVAGNFAQVRQDDCSGCGLCEELCSFDAVSLNGVAKIEAAACEGCKLCVAKCPEEAIDFPPRDCGYWMISKTRIGPLIHAQLHPGGENSGRLVALLREQAGKLAQKRGLDLVINDGSPGVGCPVISSLSGVDLALAITEPTPSGIHDLERVLDLCKHFSVPAVVLINKADLNTDKADEIEALCKERQVEVLGRLNFDPQFVESVCEGLLINEHAPQGESSQRLKQVWQRLEAMLSEQ